MPVLAEVPMCSAPKLPQWPTPARLGVLQAACRRHEWMDLTAQNEGFQRRTGDQSLISH